MNKPPLPRTEPPASPARSQPGAPVRQAVRTASRPVPAEEGRTWLASAWARHPLVAMVRHRPRFTFFLGLHSMIRAGVALPIAFSELSRGAEKAPFRRAVAQVGEAVAAGSGLAEAMRRQPMWFEPHVVELLGAAEATGTLESALARITAQLEEAQRMRWRAVSLCAYPAYLLAAFIFGGSLLGTANSLMASVIGLQGATTVSSMAWASRPGPGCQVTTPGTGPERGRVTVTRVRASSVVRARRARPS